MEALGEAQGTVDFFRPYADDFEQHGHYEHELPNDPLPDVVSRNRSVMRPYGAWVVIAPFNFPLALAGGPAAAALVTGNTVVVKGATDTPWAGRLLADCIRDAGLPPGVFQYLSGSGREVGEALSAHPATAGITFTGSVAVGTQLLQRMASGPCRAIIDADTDMLQALPQRIAEQANHRTYDLALAILHEEVEHESWFAEFLGEGPSGHGGVRTQGHSPFVSKFLH